MANIGRPSKLTEEIKHHIFECLTVKDLSIKDTAKECGISESVIYKWFDEDTEFMEFSQRVRETKAHKLINRAENVIKEIDEIETNVSDKQAVELEFKKARLVFDSYVRLAGKYNRKVYGEKIDSDITTGGEKIQTIITGIRREGDK